MSDDLNVTPGVGATVSADDVGGVLYQNIKINAGGDGASVPVVAGQQAMAESLPVVIANNQTAISTTLSSLPALTTGSANIGNVIANAGTNLNTSLLAKESGGNLAGIYGRLPIALGQSSGSASFPVVESSRFLTTVTGTVSASGHNSLVAAPALGNRIIVTSFVFQNESSAANTMILEDGTTACWRCLGQNQGDGLAMNFSPGRSWRLSNNAALQLNLSTGSQVGYSVAYYTEAV